MGMFSGCLGSEGKYKPFSVIVRDEGGDLAAKHAALNIVKSELVLMRSGKLLGGVAPWFVHNPLSKRVEFMHLETRFADMFEQSWRSTKTEIKNPIALQAGEQEDVTPVKALGAGKRLREEGNGDTSTAKLPKCSGEEDGGKSGGAGSSGGAGRGAREAAGKAPKGGKKDRDPQEDEAKNVLKEAKKLEMKQLAELKSLKNKVLTVSAAGKAVLDLIRSSSDWSYFNNESSTTPLFAAMAKVDEFFKSNVFWQSFGVVEAPDFMKAARKEFGEDAFAVQYARKSELEVLVGIVQKETTFLKKMKAARS
jgi:hypothetical protein